MFLAKDFSSKIKIINEDDKTYQFAADELKKYMRWMSGGQPMNAYQNAESKNDFEDGLAPVYIGSVEWCRNIAGDLPDISSLKHDGYLMMVKEDKIVLTGNYKRSALYAAYQLLKEAGCCWAFPGMGGEFIPKQGTIEIKEQTLLTSPDFEHRSIMFDGNLFPEDIFIPETVDFIDWMAKNQLNSYFLHIRLSKERVLPYMNLLEACSLRDMRIETGGHNFQLIVVDRESFDTKPELFRLQNGERQKNGNYCCMADGIEERAYDAVKMLLDFYPGVHNLHLWHEDIEEGAWCECDRCKNLTPAQQASRLPALISERLKKENVDVNLVHCLYHDTLDCSSLKGERPDGLLGFYAPRERCYAHALDDSACERNKRYLRELKGARNYFGDNTYIMEYYMDDIMYTNMKVAIPLTILADMKCYNGLGLEKISALNFGRVGYCLYNLNYFAYARCAWDVNTDIGIELDKIYGLYYPDLQRQVKEYFELCEAAARDALSFCGFKIDEDLRMMFHTTRQEEYYLKHISNLKNAHEKFGQCLAMLEGLISAASGAEAYMLVDEREWIKITLVELEGMILRMTSIYQRQVEHNYEDGYDKMLENFEKKKLEMKMVGALPVDITGSTGCWKGSIAYSHNCSDQILWHTWRLDDIPEEIRKKKTV